MKKIQRRDFLKYTAAGATVLAADHYLGGLSASASSDKAPYVNRNTGNKVKGIPSTCAGCAAGCGIIAYVSDGVLMKINGNPSHPVNKGRLCLVGEAGVYALADPERVLSPMKRVGKRGENHWKEISWDEASSLLAEKLKTGRGRLLLETRGGGTDEASRQFMKMMGGGKMVSHGYAVSANREAAMVGTFGAAYDLPDIAATGYILNFGANPFASDMQGVAATAAIIGASCNNGSVKMVTFDPRLSETASKSDVWLPIVPGSDGVVALAMANVIMEEGLSDNAFIQAHTNVKPEELKAHLSAYTPEAAERISGVKAEGIRRIALEYAKSPRAVLLTGGGVSSYSHGVDNERCVRLLPVITGKVDRTGCNIVPRDAGATDSDMSPDELYSNLAAGGVKAGVYMVHGCDPAYSSASPDTIKEVLADESKLPFIVSIDTHITDTGEYADLVLPLSTYLEEYAVESYPGPDGETVVRYRRPVVRPVGGSMPYLDILAATALKAGADMGYRNSGGYAAKKLMENPALSGKKDIARIEQDGFFTSPKHGAGKTASQSDPYKTGSGRIELSWKGGPGLPATSRPDLASNWKQGELMLVVYNPVGYKEGFTENNILLKELNHENPAFINSELGKALGLKNMDEVTLSSPAGRIVTKVMLSPGVHENTVVIAAGCGHTAYGNIEKGKKFDGADPFTHVIWWGHEGNGVNPNKVMPLDSPDGKGRTVTKVSLLKA